MLEWDGKGLSYTRESLNAWVSLASFQAADIGTVQTSSITERFLRKPALFAEDPDPRANFSG
jgi:hypothetical protein